MIRILFVCMGNICRSPSAEAVFRSVVEERGLPGEIGIDSAGTLDYHEGEPADPRMRRAAAARGFRLDGTARGFRRGDFGDFDWIVTMDGDNYREIVQRAETDAERNRVRRFTEWVSLPGVDEVPDPYYGGASGFEHVLDILEDGCGRFLDWIVERHGLSGTSA